MYVNTATGQYPYTVGHFRRDHSNTSFPKNISETLLARYGIKKVVYADKPSYNVATQKLVEASKPVRETDGVYTAENAPNESMIGDTIYTGRWIINYTVTDMTAEEITANDTEAARLARIVRNRLLAETDYYALSDVTMSAEMTIYRQALRDITAHENWPHLADNDWPTKP
jgi:hypothetical protein